MLIAVIGNLIVDIIIVRTRNFANFHFAHFRESKIKNMFICTGAFVLTSLVRRMATYLLVLWQPQPKMGQ